MSDESDVIETTSARLSLRDGIVYMEPRGIRSTAATVTETLDTIAEHYGNVRRPLFADARTWAGGDPQSWSQFIFRAERLFTAVAVLVGETTTPDLGGFSPPIDQLLVPFRVFDDEDRALEFLRDHRPA